MTFVHSRLNNIVLRYWIFYRLNILNNPLAGQFSIDRPRNSQCFNLSLSTGQVTFIGISFVFQMQVYPPVLER